MPSRPVSTRCLLTVASRCSAGFTPAPMVIGPRTRAGGICVALLAVLAWAGCRRVGLLPQVVSAFGSLEAATGGQIEGIAKNGVTV